MNVLFIVTSADTLAPGRATGIWLEEFTIPYMALIEAGVTVTVVSPLGGASPIDPKTAPDEKTAARWRPALEALSATKLVADVDAGGYDAVFIPGGHGPMIDLAVDPTVSDLIGSFASHGKIVAAVCHGPAALVGVRDPDGQPFLAGRKVTGFTNGEETLAQLQTVVPFLLEDRLKALGAKFEHALVPGTCHVVADGALITGQNPASSETVAKVLLDALAVRQRQTIGLTPARES